ncbi:hypothetical protein PYCC9005_001968 [Savitreella phatthalungensis]
MVAEDGEQEELSGLDEEELALRRTLSSFSLYRPYMHSVNQLRRTDLLALPYRHRQLIPKHMDVLTRADDAIDLNADFCEAMLDHASQFLLGVPWDPSLRVTPGDNDLEKARQTVRQLVRDWSAEGQAERELSNGPLLRALAKEWPDVTARSGVRVLVPGCGLARLPLDIARMGFEATGNEFSYHMLAASSYILNGIHWPHQHQIAPYVHSFSNHARREDCLRRVSIPDVCPADALGQPGEDTMPPRPPVSDGQPKEQPAHANQSSGGEMPGVNGGNRMSIAVSSSSMFNGPRHSHHITTSSPGVVGNGTVQLSRPVVLVAKGVPVAPDAHKGTISMWAGDFIESCAGVDVEATFDAVVTSFFIDTAHDPMMYMRSISDVLRPGGIWCNLGPLQWHWEGGAGRRDRDDGSALGIAGRRAVSEEGEFIGSIELAMDELLDLLPSFDFDLIKQEDHPGVPYMSDARGLHPNLYNCKFFLARKRGA